MKLIILLFLAFLPLCHMHGHSHQDDDIGHGHSHGHHGHSHGETDDFHQQLHDHYHESHHNEKPSFKYSKEANLVDDTETVEFIPDELIQEQVLLHENEYQPELYGHDNPNQEHSHGESMHHGHSHGSDNHGHSHGHNKKQNGHSYRSSEDNSHSHSHEHLHEPLIEKKQQESVDKHIADEYPDRKISTPVTEKVLAEYSDVWCEAIGATVLISLAPILILFFIPLDKKSPTHAQFLNILLSFASGGLLGDAFLHLIPHAISASGSENLASHSHSHSHGHSHGSGGNHEGNIAVSMWVLSGIVVFLAVEKFVRFAKGGHGHSHGHEEHPIKTEKDKITDKKTDKVVETNTCLGSDIKVAAYLNMAADFAHNFTDGLAIGASFMAGRNVGLITTLTILLHEVPHEIGDFAILVQSGCSKKRAMVLQMTTAIGAILGTMCSLIAEGAAGLASSWILPFTAGGFIYIATVSILPELLSESKIGQSLKEITALLIGIGMMALIAEFE